MRRPGQSDAGQRLTSATNSKHHAGSNWPALGLPKRAHVASNASPDLAGFAQAWPSKNDALFLALVMVMVACCFSFSLATVAKQFEVAG
jgi:hypothetical protein